MSERTTIGGTVYEAVGSSSSNLLLKCNGTARIQWGNKLIDLIKNGKLVTADSSTQIEVISDTSEIKKDGIYVLDTDSVSQLWVCKKGKQYNITGKDLYISASTKQDITAEQKQQALSNIGMYYNTLDEVKASGILNGIVYVLNDNSLYTVQNGDIKEFEAKIKTVTVEQEQEEGEVINSSFQIVLSVLDQEYIILKDNKITINYPMYMTNFSEFGSENASETRGYRLYMKGDISYLDVDVINVRHGLDKSDYIETTYDDLVSLIKSNKLKPHQWYLLKNYQNYWKIPQQKASNDRPILVRALTENSLYEEALLYNNQQVTLHYDWEFSENINTVAGDSTSTRGRITWMRDHKGNEANFDFLDYTDGNGNPLTTLHTIENSSEDKSIFPTNSYNNKLKVYDLKGTVLKNGNIDDTNTTEIDFQITEENLFKMHDNVIECRGLVLASSCKTFSGNTLNRVGKLQVESDIINSVINSWYTASTDISDISFSSIGNNIFSTTTLKVPLTNVKIDSIINSEINKSISDSTFKHIKECVFNNQFLEVHFKNLTECTFVDGMIANVTCNNDVTNYTTSESDVLLYDSTKSKIVYYENNKLCVIDITEQTFSRGMIMMHSGITPIPQGWAICDGNSYTYQGITTTTPNLVNRFIKAVSTSESVGEVINPDLTADNLFTIQKEHLPEHSHTHTHEFSGTDTSEVSLTFYALNSATEKTAITKLDGSTPEVSGDVTSGEDITVTDEVTVDISGTTSENSVNDEWENKSFSIEPHYYSLIFIMKL